MARYTALTKDQISTIKKIVSMEKLLNVMERHFNGKLNVEEEGKLKEYVPEWRKDIAELTEVISKLSWE